MLADADSQLPRLISLLACNLVLLAPISRCDKTQAEYLTPWGGQVTWGTFYCGEKVHFNESNPNESEYVDLSHVVLFQSHLGRLSCIVSAILLTF